MGLDRRIRRIASTGCGSWAQTFHFDAFGNITKSGNQSFNPTYDQTTNRINGGGYSARYDSNGNQLDDGIHLQSYTWNVDNNPITITGASTTTVIYDALGRAVENQNGSNTEILYGPMGGELALLNGSSLVQAYVPVVGGGTAVYKPTGLAYYRHADWLGSSRLASTPSRTVYFDGAYAPYGEGYAQSGTADWSFTGQNQDTLPNLYDFQFRRYSPVQGRWISPDPASTADLGDPQSWNRYAYVRNNPNSFVDPLGLWCSAPDGAGDTPCNPSNDPWENGGPFTGLSDWSTQVQTDWLATGSIPWYKVSTDGQIIWVPGATAQLPWIIIKLAEYDGPDVFGDFYGLRGWNLSSLGWGMSKDYFDTLAEYSGNTGSGEGPVRKWAIKTQGCVDKINDTPDGRFYNFFSPLSMVPGMGPEWKDSIEEDVGMTSLKIGAYKGLRYAQGAMPRTPFGSLSGGTADVMALGGEFFGKAMAPAAAVGQVSTRVGCGIGAL